MDAQDNNVIWTDEPDASSVPSPTASFVSVSTASAPSFHPPQFDPNTPLAAHQKNLLIIYHLHRHYEIEIMNTIVDLDISIRRERDEPGVKFLRRELEEMQDELARHREGKRRVERKIGVEKERLRKVVVGKAKEKREREKRVVATRQLEEMEKGLEKTKRKVQCLR